MRFRVSFKKDCSFETSPTTLIIVQLSNAFWYSFRMHTFLPYYYSIRGDCKDGFTYVTYINGGHPPWTLLGMYVW